MMFSRLIHIVLFAKLRSEQPRFRDKVVAVEGDCEERALGLNDFDKKRLLVSVDVVFHLAATVRFEERLRTAVNINVRGTLDLLQLCKECVHLKSVIYLTTIYSQGYQLHVDEEFYDCPLSAENIIHLVACLEDDVLTKITPALLNGWPNTYSLTKAIAEASVKAHGKELPIGIFRPGIVMSTYAEPFPGWVDNLNGGTPYTLNIALGMLHVSPTNPSYETSFVPCDMTINAIIASAWDVHQRRKSGKMEAMLYNYVPSCDNSITWGQVTDLVCKNSRKVPLGRELWEPFIIQTKFYYIYMLLSFPLHWLQALVYDVVVLSTGRRLRMMKMYMKFHRLLRITSYISLNKWEFPNKNMRDICQVISDAERKIFPFDMKDIDWDLYFFNVLKGYRLYLLKEDSVILPEVFQKRKRLYWRHQFAKALLTALVLAAVSFTFSISIYTAGVIWFGVLFYTVKSFSTSK
ncbi:fatty acyl-CoA reductase wat-like isoform X2 [Periplaneta americana]|uniref:fatty acyl-CoA reductase wat-like isoform X2 n=1 Tax=Periplaneta americana TaxID=6978 RepID=UPI0037E737B2